MQPSTVVAYNSGQQIALNGAGPKPGPQTTNLNHHLHQQLQDAGSSNGPLQVVPRLMPKNQQQHDSAAGYHPQQQAQYQDAVANVNKQHLSSLHHHPQHINHQTPTSQLPSLNQGPNLHHQMGKSYWLSDTMMISNFDHEKVLKTNPHLM